MRLLCLLFMVYSCIDLTAQGRIYIDATATGAGDGSSWSNAFVSFADAMVASERGDTLWLKEGTYIAPNKTSIADTSFYMPHDLVILGGFDGTEARPTDRDPDKYSVLSGDQNQDDIDRNFAQNKEDNNLHVLYVPPFITDASIFNQITFSGGFTQDDTGTGDDRRGGGVLCYGAPTFANCVFSNNYGYFGGGLYPRGGDANEIEILGCTFENNFGGFGAGLYINSPTSFIVGNVFANNVVTTRGGALYNNTTGGSLIARNVFENNEAQTSRGGALYNSESPSLIQDCSFSANIALESSGGALQIRTDDATPGPVEVLVQRCSFINSEARFGGAVGVYDSLSIGIIDSCYFEGNRSQNVGGAISNAFGATTRVSVSNFLSNDSGNGGAVYSQNDRAVVEIDACNFDGNTANFGGALGISGDGDLESAALAKMTLTNSILQNNSAETQGGGINLNDVNADIVSTLIVNNRTESAESIGSGISINSGDTTAVFINITNSTIADNEGSFFAGISHFTGEVDGFSQLTLQNTILANELGGDNYTVEAGTPTLLSGGGNLSTDDSADEFLLESTDIHRGEPNFSMSAPLQYDPIEPSPCINGGVDAGAPTTDILGNPRVQTTDIGAIEYQVIVSNRDILKLGNRLQVLGNPGTSNTIQFKLESSLDQMLTSVTNLSGMTISKGYARLQEGRYRIDIPDLANGTYFVLAQDENGLLHTGTYIKL